MLQNIFPEDRRDYMARMGVIIFNLKWFRRIFSAALTSLQTFPAWCCRALYIRLIRKRLNGVDLHSQMSVLDFLPMVDLLLSLKQLIHSTHYLELQSFVFEMVSNSVNHKITDRQKSLWTVSSTDPDDRPPLSAIMGTLRIFGLILMIVITVGFLRARSKDAWTGIKAIL